MMPPLITLVGGAFVEIRFGTNYSDPGFAATDFVDGDLSDEVVRTGEVNTAIAGEYPIRYSVVDSAGNKAVALRTVRVVDAESPNLTGVLELTDTEPPSTLDIFTGLTARDPQSGDLSHRIVLVRDNVNWFDPGSYGMVFSVADLAGNTTTLTGQSLWVQMPFTTLHSSPG